DADLRLIAWNQRYIDMFSYPPGLVEVGKPVADVIRYNLQRGLIDSEDIEAEIQKRLSYLKQGSAYKFQRRQQDGSVLEMQGNPLPGGGFVTTYSDVSAFINTQQQLEQRVAERTQALQQLNQQLRQAQQKIEATTQAKTRFFAAASHDLMQPFNASALFASLLRDKQTTPELKQLSQNLISSLNSAEELLGAILELTKLDSGVIKAEVQTVSLGALLDDIARDAAVLAQEKGLQLHYIKSKLAVSTDRKLVKRVIQNLLANAIRYTEQGKVILAVKRRGVQLQICVLDSGVGIAPQDQQRIFEEFQQGEQQDQRGLGLGLAIASRITAILGHSLQLHSVPGKGSCFSILLPLATAQPIPPTAPARADTGASFAGKTILLLDNEPQLRSAVAELLRSWQINVAAVGQPAEALQAIQQGLKADALLFDYHLDNNATGVEVAGQLAAHFGVNVPVVIHSADHSEAVREHALNAGYYFLLKPLKAAALKKLFQRLLR
ncbi:MAG TPA: PAS-domain containing protein, partial [Rheinheimera sp.]|nr:PAS-domain containing protein [Rheinheimera sp.]